MGPPCSIRVGHHVPLKKMVGPFTNRSQIFLQVPKRGTSFKPLTPVKFEQISDWYSFAILELATLPKFEFNPAWIIDQLGITRPEAKHALNTLKRLGLLYQSKEGKGIGITHRKTRN